MNQQHSRVSTRHPTREANRAQLPREGHFQIASPTGTRYYTLRRRAEPAEMGTCTRSRLRRLCLMDIGTADSVEQDPFENSLRAKTTSPQTQFFESGGLEDIGARSSCSFSQETRTIGRQRDWSSTHISYFHARRIVAVRISEKQFDTLIARPLQLVMAGRALILVIPDVLDQCDVDGATTILSLIACEIPKIRGLKVFVTARPERHIRNKLDQYHDLKQFHMQDIERSIVEADIQHYLESRLSAQAVQRAFPELGPSPRQLTTEQMKIFVEKAFHHRTYSIRFHSGPHACRSCKQDSHCD